MTTHLDPLEAWCGIAEAAGINTLAACIELVKAAGYTVSKPKPKAVGFRWDALPQYATAQRKWDRTQVTWTFADGTEIKCYALRESASKQWFLGSSLRAACDKYRYARNRTLIGYYASELCSSVNRASGTFKRGKWQESKMLPGYTMPIGPVRGERWTETPIDLIEVPEVTGCSVECDLGQVNQLSAGYRSADATRPRKLFEGTAF